MQTYTRTLLAFQTNHLFPWAAFVRKYAVRQSDVKIRLQKLLALHDGCIQIQKPVA